MRSANFFFLITNQNNENPPTPTTAVEPTAIPAIAPPERPSFSLGSSVVGGVSVSGGNFAILSSLE